MLSFTDAQCFIFRSVSYCKSFNDHKFLSSDCLLSYSSVRDIIKDLLRKVCLDERRFGVHSLRSGGASAAAGAGVSDRVFKRHGRWRSDLLAKDGYVKPSMSELLSVTLIIGL